MCHAHYLDKKVPRVESLEELQAFLRGLDIRLLVARLYVSIAISR